MQDIKFWKRHTTMYEQSIKQLLTVTWGALYRDPVLALPALESTAWMGRHGWTSGWQGFRAAGRYRSRAGAEQRSSGVSGASLSITCTCADTAWRLLECLCVLGKATGKSACGLF